MLPLLYSFRRCPYAIRARMALKYSAISYELREVSLKEKPAKMLKASAKATVPVMVLPDKTVLDESNSIIQWALQQSDPDQWLKANANRKMQNLMNENDQTFKQHLDHYKYADRHPQQPPTYYREQACSFLQKLEDCLRDNQYLFNKQLSLADVMIFPFIRQFAFVDKPWFDQSPYPSLRGWLNGMLASNLFSQVMDKYSVWREDQDAVIISNIR
jgi:glutathione S-transferase